MNHNPLTRDRARVVAVPDRTVPGHHRPGRALGRNGSRLRGDLLLVRMTPQAMRPRDHLGAAAGFGELVTRPAQGEELVVHRERGRQPVLVRVQRQLLRAQRPDAGNQLGQQSALPAHDLREGLDLRSQDDVLVDRIPTKEHRGGTAPRLALRLLCKPQTGLPQTPRELWRSYVTQDGVALLLYLMDVLRHVEAFDVGRHLVRQVERLPGPGQAFRRWPRLGPRSRSLESCSSGSRHHL